MFNTRVARTTTGIVRSLRERIIQQPTTRQMNKFLALPR